MKVLKFVPALMAGCCLVVGPATAQDQTPEEFYSNKPLTLMIGYSPGGGYDNYARLLARHIGNHIPGNPDVIVENMPGAGSLTLANHIANVAPRDGSVIAAIDRSLPTLPLLDAENAQFEVDTFNWLGSITSEAYVCIAWHDSGFESWDQVMDGDETFIVGGTGPQAENENTPRLLTNLLGANIRIVSGYPGSAEVGIAMEQGEVDGQCGSWSGISTRGDWIDNQQINLLLQMGSEPAPGLEDVPLVYDYAETEEERQVIQLVTSRLQTARPYVAPPDVPEDRLRVLLDAFAAATSDPELLAEAEQLGLELTPVTGDDMLAFIESIYEAPPEIVERAMEVVAID